MISRPKLVIAAIVCGCFAVMAMFGAGAWFIVTHGVGNATGDLRSAVGNEYEPTSSWIEDGLDPNVTTFGFENGSAEPTGPELEESQIRALVNAKQNDLMQCYASALQDDDELQGRVDFQFGIAPDGHVAMVKVTRSTLASTTTEDCMVEQARQWSFPRTNRAALLKFDTDFTFVYE